MRTRGSILPAKTEIFPPIFMDHWILPSNHNLPFVQRGSFSYERRLLMYNRIGKSVKIVFQTSSKRFRKEWKYTRLVYVKIFIKQWIRIVHKYKRPIDTDTRYQYWSFPRKENTSLKNMFVLFLLTVTSTWINSSRATFKAIIPPPIFTSS